MLTEKDLTDLKDKLRPYLPVFKKTIASIKDQDISNYPVFLIFRGDVDAGVGLTLIDKGHLSDDWVVNASTLEEMASKKIVAMQNVERFTEVYKSNTESACCFVWTQGAAQVAFIPLRPKK